MTIIPLSLKPRKIKLSINVGSLGGRFARKSIRSTAFPPDYYCLKLDLAWIFILKTTFSLLEITLHTLKFKDVFLEFQGCSNSY